MITYRATLDVSRELVRHVAHLLWAERRRRHTRKGSRALTRFWQAVLVLRWFRDRTDPAALGRDHGISRATAYRYIDEVIQVLAAQAPDLHEALQRAQDDGLPHLIMDGTVIASDRCREQTMSVKGEAIDLWVLRQGTSPWRGGSARPSEILRHGAERAPPPSWRIYPVLCEAFWIIISIYEQQSPTVHRNRSGTRRHDCTAPRCYLLDRPLR